MPGYYIKRTNITADRDVIIIGKRLICGENAEPFDSVKSAKSAISRQKKQDGAYKVSDLRSFENGNVGHPELSHGKPFHGYKCKYLYEVNGEVYYEAIDIKTRKKNVMTAKDLIC